MIPTYSVIARSPVLTERSETLLGGRRAHGRGASVVGGDVEQAADRRYDDDTERRTVQPRVSASIRRTASRASGISWISVWMRSAERR
jgi:hypothetical protein